jgi:hypothetical protein
MEFRKGQETLPTPLPLISTQNYFGLHDLFDQHEETLKHSDFDESFRFPGARINIIITHAD